MEGATGIVDAVKAGLAGQQDEILKGGVAAVGVSIVLLGGRRAWGYFAKLFKA